MSKTFAELAKDERGTKYEDWFEDGIRCVILRGGQSLCAYLGVPKNHPLAGRDYEKLNLDCHGGLTYSGEDKGGKYLPAGYWWYGWDYAHLGDRAMYTLDYPDMMPLTSREQEWIVFEVKQDMQGAIWDFAKLMKLAEEISNDRNK